SACTAANRCPSSHTTSVSTGQQVINGLSARSNCAVQAWWKASLRDSKATSGPVSINTRSVTAEIVEVMLVRAEIGRCIRNDADTPKPFGPGVQALPRGARRVQTFHEFKDFLLVQRRQAADRFDEFFLHGHGRTRSPIADSTIAHIAGLLKRYQPAGQLAFYA